MADPILSDLRIAAEHEPNHHDACIRIDDSYMPSNLVETLAEEFTLSDNESKFFNACFPCLHIHELFNQSLLDDISVQSLFSFCYASVWLIGLFGNGLVLAVVLVSSYLRHRYGLTERLGRLNSAFPVRSVFVVSLACSDLLITVTSLPVTAVNMFTQIWIFPDFMCYCIGFFQAFSIFQSSFTFTCIAVDRCLLITRPKRTVITYRSARLIVIFTAVLACLLASPMAFLMRMEKLDPICGRFCVESWPSSTEQTYYGICVILLQFALPAAVSTVCYWIIGVRLKRRHRNRFVVRRGTGGTNNGGDGRSSMMTTAGTNNSDGPPTPARWRANERRIRTNRMMACMVAAFVLLWMPFNFLNLLRDLNLSVDIFQRARYSPNTNYSLLYSAAHLFAMISVIWNPVMYAWYNESIRHVLRPVLAFCRPRRMSESTSNYQRTRGDDDEGPEEMIENNSIAPSTNQYAIVKSDMF